MVVKVLQSDIDGLLARIESGETNKDDANLLRAILQQMQGTIAALEAMVDDD